jgi:hypothetical protein
MRFELMVPVLAVTTGFGPVGINHSPTLPGAARHLCQRALRLST